MANPITLQEFAYLLDKNLETVFSEYLDPKNLVYPQLFNVKKVNSLAYETAGVGSVPDIPEFDGKISYLAVAPEFKTRIETREFAGGLVIERRLLDTANDDAMRDKQSGLARALQRTKEKRAANVFNYAFSAAWEFMTNDEAVALCGQHTTKSGVSTSSGFLNAGSSALSKTSVIATAQAMMKFKDDIGEFFDCIPDTLVVPVALYDTALEICGYDPRTGATSFLDPSSGNNAINTAFKRFKVIPWIYLDQFSTQNWFMTDSRLMKRFLLWIDRVESEFHTIADYETMSIRQIVYSSFACGFVNWRFIFGHQVS